MQSLFDAATSQDYLKRINKLTPETKALWGKMNVAQMLAHVNTGFYSALGDVKGKRIFLGYIFGAMAKKDMMSPKPFKQNLPTAKNFVKLGQACNFDEEKQKLVSLINRYVKGGQTGLTSEPHSFFGVMTANEWDWLMTKHLNHHLQQFGA